MLRPRPNGYNSAMPRTCTVCTHSERAEIDQALLAGEPFRNIAKRYGTSPPALFRHRKADIPATLAKAKEAAEEATADSLFDRLKGLAAEAKAILEEARASNHHSVALQAIGRAEKLLELEARLLGELNDATRVSVGIRVNAILTPEYFRNASADELLHLMRTLDNVLEGATEEQATLPSGNDVD